jgi:outer membrane protein OmpA-like peptidoglycan-associated protein
LFATGISTLTSKANALLDSLVFKLKGSSVDSIVVEGHTDIVGKHEMNQKLSMDRAMSVGNYLQQQFLNGKIIKRGWASDKPVADNKTSSGRQLNRRVEIYVYIRD